MLETIFAISFGIVLISSVVLASKAIHTIYVTDKLNKLTEEKLRHEVELESEYNRYVDLFGGDK